MKGVKSNNICFSVTFPLSETSKSVTAETNKNQRWIYQQNCWKPEEDGEEQECSRLTRLKEWKLEGPTCASDQQMIVVSLIQLCFPAESAVWGIIAFLLRPIRPHPHRLPLPHNVACAHTELTDVGWGRGGQLFEMFVSQSIIILGNADGTFGSGWYLPLLNGGTKYMQWFQAEKPLPLFSDVNIFTLFSV